MYDEYRSLAQRLSKNPENAYYLRRDMNHQLDKIAKDDGVVQIITREAPEFSRILKAREEELTRERRQEKNFKSEFSI